MAFSKTHFDAVSDRLKSAIKDLTRGYEAAYSAVHGDSPLDTATKAARAGHVDALADLIDSKLLARAVKLRGHLRHVDFSEIIRGHEAYETARAKAAKKYESKLRALADKRLDAYLTDGEPVNVDAAVTELRAVPQV